MGFRKTLRYLAAAMLGLALFAGYASHARAATAETGNLHITFADAGDGKVTGACVELWTEVDGDYGEQVATICDTIGGDVRPLPHGSYILHEIQPPSVLVLPDGRTEGHVYQKATDEHVVLDVADVYVTMHHAPGAQIDVSAVLPDGGGASSSCFAAKLRNEGGRVVDEACTGTNAGTSLFVPPGPLEISQTSGPDGYGIADDAFLDGVAIDGRYSVTVTMTMKDGGSIRIEQKGPGDGLIEGGCYSVYSSPSDGDEEFWAYRCDRSDDAGDDGVVHVDELRPGRYRLVEDEAPAGYKLGQGYIYVAVTGDELLVRHHDPLPVLTVRTVNPAGAPVPGSCWHLTTPDDEEGWLAEECDGDDGSDDGTTRFTTVTPGDYELVQWSAPDGYERLEDPRPFTMDDADTDVVVTLVGDGAPPANATLPAIEGDVAVGSHLTADPGTWTGGDPIDFAYQWLQCEVSGDPCVPVGGATGATYTVRTSDAGMSLRLDVKASNAAGTAEARSDATGRVRWVPPTASIPPAIRGTMKVGATLTAFQGRWAGARPITYDLRWLRCDPQGEACSAIDGETGTTYTLARADVASALRLEVTAGNADGKTVAQSAPRLLPANPPRAILQPSITGAIRVGSTLTGHPGKWTGEKPIALDYQWLRCDETGASCAAIDGATTTAYELSDADRNSTFRFEVTAVNVDGTTKAASPATDLLPPKWPRATLIPTITGRVSDGELVGGLGRWTGTTPMTFEHQWLRCDTTGENCTEIAGATGKRYNVRRADRGFTLRFEVTATNADGEGSARSLPTRVVG